ncbi:MAG: lipoyl synthase [Nitrospiraceae bacterium]|nr:MAG: lipoyl synthase [Nitrospiraceae bacterium]
MSTMRHPEWIKVPLTGTHETRKLLRSFGLSTVCEEARCPNQGACFSNNTATFMILGDKCTRNCSFCAVDSDIPGPPDPDEPYRVAKASVKLGLAFVVITSVTRDDLKDGGAGHFTDTIKAIRKLKKNIKTEVLTPDFKGNYQALKSLLEAGPDVFNHNIETVPRLYDTVRPQADYLLSINILKRAKQMFPHIMTKSGMMVGLGETYREILEVMQDLKRAGCDYLTIGQYLQPRRNNIPVAEYIRPEVFEQYKQEALDMGFRAVASSPLTRSSLNAGALFEGASAESAFI